MVTFVEVTQLAKALYDNAAETAEELSFRKGDIMMVVERDTAGLRGWWLCSLHGRQGIVPGNRVKLLEGTGGGSSFHCARRDPGSGHRSPPPHHCLEEGLEPVEAQSVYQVPPRLDGPGMQGAGEETDVYQVPPGHDITSRECGGASTARENEYLFPDAETEGTGDSGARKSLHKVYTVPPTARVCPSTPAVAVGSLTQDDTYRVPRGSSEESEPCSQRHQEVYDTPSSLLADPSVAGNTYDIPACFAKKVARVTPQTAPSPPPAEEIPEDMYDVPLAFQNPPLKDDPEVYATPSNLKRAPAVHNLYEAPEDVLDAGPEEARDAGGESSIYDVPALAQEEEEEEEPEELPSGGFHRLSISRPPAQVHRPRLPSSESLSRRPLPALPTQLGAGETSPAATGSSPPVFVRKGSIQDRPLPPPPPSAYGHPNKGERPQNEYEGIQPAEEYEYVHLKGSDRARSQTDSNPSPPELPQDETLSARAARTPEDGAAGGPAESQVSGNGASSGSPDAEDTQLLHFYAGQCQGHYEALLASIEAFLAAVRTNQPPRAFVPQGKSVIVAAHKLVFVGDTLSRLAASPGTRARVTAAGGALCEALKGVVLAAKSAALRYPSPPAAQGVADRVTELSGRALDFTALLRRLSS
ncbi:embryonal Fyn-associated substrate-like isoform X2 [Rhinatrema bivittatum]|uniref:embryonal Fyn-associated substrate-like isoform X2 n=1 Tax=Rhinatrema bivittatum TaxID=194408 RepID=UPI00112926C5|nr:embryonal Fyn-associated substrate-like isoform X2 [Rhinatrema bivittatum]